MLSRLGLASAVALLCLVRLGCGGSSSPSPPPSPSPTPTATGPPTVTVSPASANAFVGQTVTLTWTSTNATSCAASGAWNGPLGTSGSQSVTPSSAGAQTYSIACSGSGGSANASSTVTATTPAVSITKCTFRRTASRSRRARALRTVIGDLWVASPRGLDIDSGYGYGPTKVRRLLHLLERSGVLSRNAHSRLPSRGLCRQQMLAGIDAGIASFARTGTRLMIRFIYNFGPTANGRDAPIDLISTHIDQLAPILLKNRDLIFALEAGFIGTWGEWHHSLNGNDSAAPTNWFSTKSCPTSKACFPFSCATQPR